MKLFKSRLLFSFGILFFLYSLFSLNAGFVLAAEKTEAERYAVAVPGAGSLVLNVPTSWETKLRQLSESVFGNPVIVVDLVPKQGEEFFAEITLVANSYPKRGPVSLTELKQQFEDLVTTSILPESESYFLPLQEIRGPQAKGYYVVSRKKDTKLELGKWKIYIKGMVLIKKMILIFDITLNENESPIKAMFLKMITNSSSQ